MMKIDTIENFERFWKADLWYCIVKMNDLRYLRALPIRKHQAVQPYQVINEAFESQVHLYILIS